MINVRIAAVFAQKESLPSPSLSPPQGPLSCVAMADRNSPAIRLAAERERLRAIARRNEAAAKERMRTKQEASSAAVAAEKAKGAAERAAKAAGMAFPKIEELVIKPITRPPPGVSPGKRRGTSPAAIPQQAMPVTGRALSPRPPSYPPPLASGSARETPPPARSPSEEHVSVFGDTPEAVTSRAMGSGELKSALVGGSSQRRGPPKVAFVAEAAVIPESGETPEEYKCRVARERYTSVVWRHNGRSGNDRLLQAGARCVQQRNYFPVRDECDVFAALGGGSQGHRHFLLAVTKTFNQFHAWMHPDHFSVLCKRSKSHHDLIRNGFLALAQAAAALKTQLKSGELVVGITGSLPFPKEQKEYFLRPNITSYQSIRKTAEHQSTTYVTPVTKPVHILPETPLIPWRSKSGYVYQIAPPYTLMVPPSFPEAIHMRVPEYSWAQGLLVAVHSLTFAFGNNTNCPSMKLEESAEKLDSLRHVHKIHSVPAAWFYLSNCRSLHSMDVQGPTAVSGWRQFVTGEPFIRNKNIVAMGDSGCHVYSSTGKKHHSIVADLRASAGYPNIHDLTEVGAHPYRQLELLRDWINRHLRYGFPKPVSLGEGAFFGTDFVVIWFDAHNGLQMTAKGVHWTWLHLPIWQDNVRRVHNANGRVITFFTGGVLLH